MSKMLNENLGTVDYDEVIIGNFPVADVVMVKLAGGQGVVKRGTVVTGDPGGEMKAIAAAVTAGKALYIVTDDTDTGETPGEEEEEEPPAAVFATVYRSGKFNRKKVLTDGSYKLTAADEEYLRLGNILMEDAI